MLFGALRIGKYLRLLPPGVTIGMVNALCVLLVLLQFRYFKELPGADGGQDANADATYSAMEEPVRHLESTSNTTSEDSLNQPWAYYYGYDLPWNDSSQIIIVSFQALAAFLICLFLPRYTRILPSSLVALVVLTLVNIGLVELTDWVAPTVGDYCTSEVSSYYAAQDIEWH